MARLYADENFPFPVTEALRKLEHDVLTVSEANQAEQAIPDDEVLTFATSRERAVLTLNRKDFMRLHRESAEHAGIIVCTFDPNFSAQAARIHKALDEQPDLAGQLLRVNRANT